MGEPGRRAAVGAVSAATLMFEVLLVRIFSIEQFHHFAFMAVGVAMLGFGLAGTSYSLLQRPGTDGNTWFRITVPLTALALLLCPWASHLVQLDPIQLLWDRSQWPSLAVLYVILSVPFLAGGLAVLSGLDLSRRTPGTVYAASLWGGGAGAVLALGSMWLDPTQGAQLPAVVAAVGALGCVNGTKSRVVMPAILVLSLVAVRFPPWDLELSPYKGLYQTTSLPDSRIVTTRHHPAGWLAAVEAPAFRRAPGLSLGYAGEFPPQLALFLNGEESGAISDWSSAAGKELLDWLPAASPYRLRNVAHVLVIGAGAGTELEEALRNEVESITAVELHPGLAELAARRTQALEDESGRAIWHVGDARSFVARTDQRFDLIAVGPGGAWSGSTGGVHALSEDYLHTREAYRQYLDALAPQGVLAVTRWVAIPPREGVRVLLTLGEALRQAGTADPSRHLAIVRSWGTVTILASGTPLTSVEIERLASWTTERGFDIDWPPRGTSHADFHRLEDQAFRRAATALSRGTPAVREFVETYPVSVGPLPDRQPYPHHFLRLGQSLEMLVGDPGDRLPLAELGTLTVLATLSQAALVSILLLLLPAALSRRRHQVGIRVVLYFGAIGLGYLTLEIAVIQYLSLLLGHPIYAVTATLALMLVFSGLGSFWADRWRSFTPRSAGLWLAASALALGWGFLTLVHWVAPAALVVRVIFAFIVLTPVAFIMGFPFPAGFRSMVGSSGAAGWAWASNGFASVVATPLAALLALEAGLPWVMSLSGAAYLVASLSWSEESA